MNTFAAVAGVVAYLVFAAAMLLGLFRITIPLAAYTLLLTIYMAYWVAVRLKARRLFMQHADWQKLPTYLRSLEPHDLHDQFYHRDANHLPPEARREVVAMAMAYATDNVWYKLMLLVMMLGMIVPVVLLVFTDYWSTRLMIFGTFGLVIPLLAAHSHYVRYLVDRKIREMLITGDF